MTTKRKHKWRKSFIVLLSSALLYVSLPVAHIQKAEAQPLQIDQELLREITQEVTQVNNLPELVLREESPITSGATLRSYDWLLTDSNKEARTKVYIIEIDLHNPMVKLDTMAGTEGQYTKRQTIQGMVTETGAVAGVNGDFYNMQAEGVPNGPQIVDGQLISTSIDLPGLYSFALDHNRRPVIDMFATEGEVRTIDGATYPLGGVNKTYYWYEPSGEHSMIDGLYMYTNVWGQENRSNDGVTVPTEVMVRNGIITEIAPSAVIREIAPEDGYILRASGKAAEFVVNHMKVGDPLLANYQLTPRDSEKIYDTANFQTMIGGGTILVDEGQPAEFSRKNDADTNRPRSRTAIGYSQDERFVYLVTAERSSTSAGLTMPQLQQLMIQLGSWKAMNLDGGGSTQIVSRPLGEFNTQLINQPEDTVARRVVNGLGIFSLAPQGNPLGLMIAGPQRLFINERASFQVKAYDQYYNPIDMTDVSLQWDIAEDIAMMEEGHLVMLKSGTTSVTASYGGASQSIEVSAIGREDIASMRLTSPAVVLDEESRINLQVVATLNDGTTRVVPSELIQWEWRGLEGVMEHNTLTVDEVSNSRLVQFIANYDGFRTMLSMPVGQRKLWADFDEFTPAFQFQSYPSGVTGEVALIGSLPDRELQDRALYLGYDFRDGIGTKAAYAAFGEQGQGIELAGTPHSIRMEVLGDQSGHWLRAEMVDGNGKSYLVQLGDQVIDWNGWKTVETHLSNLGMAYPVTLKRIYVASPERGQEDRPQMGAIAIDNISFLYSGLQPSDLAKPVVYLEIDNNQMMVDDQKLTIDQPPVILADHTMVPVRFVVEALGGEIEWDGDERKVTVIKDDHLIDMWLDKDDVIMNGVSVKSAIAPTLMNERTMVPLRLLSEKLGWEVLWNDENRSVTLQ